MTPPATVDLHNAPSLDVRFGGIDILGLRRAVCILAMVSTCASRRFGFIGEAPTIQICNEGAFIYTRHYMEKDRTIAIEVLLLHCSRVSFDKITAWIIASLAYPRPRLCIMEKQYLMRGFAPPVPQQCPFARPIHAVQGLESPWTRKPSTTVG